MDDGVGSCNLCGGDRVKTLFHESVSNSDDELAIAKCMDCGLVFTSPQPSDEFLEKLYSEDGYESDSMSGHYCLDAELGQVDHLKILTRLDGLIEGRRLLDVGCGTGIFIKRALADGWDAFGNEPSSFVEATAEKEFENRIQFAYLSECNYKIESFDVVTLWYVLEHVTNPSMVLSEVARFIKDGGFVFIAVPNWNYIALRRLFSKLLGKPGIVHASEHLYQYTPKTIEKYLEKSGFKVECEIMATPFYNSGGLVNLLKKTAGVFVLMLWQVTGVSLGGLMMIARKTSN